MEGWENHLQEYTMDISGVHVNVYHSVGFGTDISEQWMADIGKYFAERHDGVEDEMLPGNRRIHTVFYIINGAGQNASPSEWESLKTICDEHGVSPCVVISHCDTAGEAKIKAIEEEAAKQQIPSIRVNAIRGKGDKGARFGRTAAMSQVLADSFVIVGRDLSQLIIEVTNEMMKAILPEIQAKVRKSTISYIRVGVTNDKLEEVQKYIREKYIRTYRRDVLPIYQQYYRYMTGYKISFDGRDEVVGCMEEVRESLRIVSVDGMTLSGIVEGSTPDRYIRSNSDGFVQMIIFMGKFMRMKTTLGRSFDTIFSRQKTKLEKQLKMLERFGTDDGFITPKGAFEEGSIYDENAFEGLKYGQEK